jgi:hypothetical protein
MRREPLPVNRIVLGIALEGPAGRRERVKNRLHRHRSAEISRLTQLFSLVRIRSAGVKRTDNGTA